MWAWYRPRPWGEAHLTLIFTQSFQVKQFIHGLHFYLPVIFQVGYNREACRHGFIGHKRSSIFLLFAAGYLGLGVLELLLDVTPARWRTKYQHTHDPQQCWPLCCNECSRCQRWPRYVGCVWGVFYSSTKWQLGSVTQIAPYQTVGMHSMVLEGSVTIVLSSAGEIMRTCCQKYSLLSSKHGK